MTVPLCKDCIYHSPFEQTNYKGVFDKCTRNPTINRVSGEKSYDNCGLERCYRSSCGPDGKYFVPKDQNILTQSVKPVSFWSRLKFWN